MQKNVIVPDSELRQLEEARLLLHDLAEEYGIETYQLMKVTGIMWRLAHKKYPEYSLRIKDFVGNEQDLLNKRVRSMKDHNELGTITSIHMDERYPCCHINWDNGKESHYFIDNLNNFVCGE